MGEGAFREMTTEELLANALSDMFTAVGPQLKEKQLARLEIATKKIAKVVDKMAADEARRICKLLQVEVAAGFKLVGEDVDKLQPKRVNRGTK